MKVLELMHSLEEAYERFGDIEVKIIIPGKDAYMGFTHIPKIKELIIECDEFIIKCE